MHHHQRSTGNIKYAQETSTNSLLVLYYKMFQTARLVFHYVFFFHKLRITMSYYGCTFVCLY